MIQRYFCTDFRFLTNWLKHFTENKNNQLVDPGPCYHLQIVWTLVSSLSFWACGLVETIIFNKDETKSMMLNLVSYEVFKMLICELAIWLALCLLYPFFIIPSFFSGSYWWQ
jgi:hypothetical protein